MSNANYLLWQIRKDKSEQRLVEFDNIFIPKCIQIFEQLMSVQLKPNDIKRQRIAVSDTSASIKYKFKYGDVYIKSRYNQELFFKFSFGTGVQDDDLYVPFNSTDLTVKVDDDLNFIKGFFVTQIHVSNIDFGINLDNHCFATLKLTRSVDNNDEQKTVIEYLNERDITYEFINLHSDFYSCNNTFDKVFMTMMNHMEENPTLFYSVFSEYPAYSDLMLRREKVFDFLMLFHKQYTDDPSTLNARFLLLDMQRI